MCGTLTSISAVEARRLAAEQIEALFGDDPSPVILDDETMETDVGWVFFYESPLYLQTKDPNDSLLGNAPILVRQDGLVTVTGTAHPIEEYLDIWRHAMKGGRSDG
jgi:hypothetical protein